MEYYLAIERNEILTYATSWMNLIDMINERNQSQKATCYITNCMKCPK